MPQVYSMKAAHQRIDPLPEGAIYVGRAVPRMKVKGSRWGNRYRVGTGPTTLALLHAYADWLAGELTRDPHALDELANRDLVCWCKSPSSKRAPCHADMLLVAARNPQHWLAVWREARAIEKEAAQAGIRPDVQWELVKRHALLVREMEQGTAPETFRCTECKRFISAAYMAKGRPYGLDDPVCEMCVSYYDYFIGPDDEDDEE